MSLENLPCTSPSAFSQTASGASAGSSSGGLRRLLPLSSPLTTPEKQRPNALRTETAELPEILLIAGTDPGCRQRVRFNSMHIRLPFLDEAMGMAKEEGTHREQMEEEESAREEEKGKGGGEGEGEEKEKEGEKKKKKEEAVKFEERLRKRSRRQLAK